MPKNHVKEAEIFTRGNASYEENYFQAAQVVELHRIGDLLEQVAEHLGRLA